MNLKIARNVMLAVAAALLVACGDSTDNASPGSLLVEVPVAGGGGDTGGGDTGGGDTGGGGGTGGGTDSAPAIASVIPDGVANAFSMSDMVAGAGFGSKPVMNIDVSMLPGGVLDPTGLVLGNDVVFSISGGALRVTPPTATAAADAGFKRRVGGGRLGITELPDCQLRLAPGAVLAGSSAADFIVINRGCAIIAEGTADAPIILTAMPEVLGEVEDNDRGLWGGLVINGRAPINDCPEGATGGTAGCTKEGEANSGTFGGDQPDDNSGILQYVSVRYAGSNVDPENQLNGIAFQGVGSETVCDHIQVHNNLDDGVEFFGGSVSCKFVALTGNADDSLDWTDGWTGNLQFLYIEQTDQSDNAIEADNREGNENATPRSNPTIANMTVVGNPGERALRLRRGTGLTLRNSFIDGSERCIRVDGGSRELLGTQVIFEGVSLACAQTHESDSDGAVASTLAGSVNVSTSGDSVDPVNRADAFFANTDHIGAFGADNWTAGWTAPGSISQPTQPDFGCPQGTTTATRMINNRRVCELSGTLTSDLLLTANNLYSLINKVQVGRDNTDAATLTIQAGTTLFGGSQSDFMVVSRGSRIVANGTLTAPVTFTSQADVEGQATAPGQWGGLVINGNAPINDCPEGASGGTAGCTKEGEANSGLFGGANPNDNSGRLKYVVVKHAGSAVDAENQLNGIAFQGVGAATEVDFIQVHQNLDDGVEFFGGTVNATHVVLTDNRDDSLDWTDGWSGNVQFLLIDQAEGPGDNGIEADNREGNETATPRSLPRIANMTLTGLSGERAIVLRRGTGLALFSSIVQGAGTCLRVQGDSVNQLGTGITFEGVSFSCDTVVEGDDVAAIQAQLDASANVSTSGRSVNAALLAGDAFFQDTSYIGAIENSDHDWTFGWAFGMPNTTADLGCPPGTTEVAMLDGTRRTCQLTGTLTQDVTLSRNNLYVLEGKVQVGNDNADSATLTIQSGTTIVGVSESDFLVVARGSRINVNGTQNMPVTMTADEDLLGTLANPDTTRGLWGGLVINGNAPINDCPEGASGGTVGCTKQGEADSGLFGGADANDSSGRINYLVVKYAGARVDSENELNGIAFQGVGAGTEVDHVQVFNNLDDGIEFFGGTVNASHVVLVGNGDDSLDWTDGWTGSLQYLHIVQVASGDNMFEADNREGNTTAMPISEPNIANATLIGLPGERAIRLRRGTGLHLFNSAVSGADNCLRIQDESLNLLDTRIEFAGTAFGCSTAVEGDDVDAITTFLQGENNVTLDGSQPTPVGLPGSFDSSGALIIGSDVANWGAGWTVGLGL